MAAMTKQEWVEKFIRRNPMSTIKEIARAANNNRVGLHPTEIADIRREVLKEIDRQDKGVIPSRTNLVDVEVVVNPKTGAATVQSSPRLMDGPPLKPFNPPKVVAQVLSASAPPPPSPAPPPSGAAPPAEGAESSNRVRRVFGTAKKVLQMLPIAGDNPREDKVAVILECKHVRVMTRSQVRESALCSICQRAQAKEEMLRKPLQALVREFGTDAVMEALATIERQAAPPEVDGGDA